jgi:hypothetical protein
VVFKFRGLDGCIALTRLAFRISLGASLGIIEKGYV